MSNNQDQLPGCAGRGEGFTWGAGGQGLFREKGFTNPPKRCRQCRQDEKEQRGGDRKGGNG